MFSDKAYEDMVDSHLDHSEENSNPKCLLCQKSGYVEDEDEKVISYIVGDNRTGKSDFYSSKVLRSLRESYSELELKKRKPEDFEESKKEILRKFNKLDKILKENDPKYEHYRA